MRIIIMLVYGKLYHACILVFYHNLHMLGSPEFILRVGNCIKEHKILATAWLSIDGIVNILFMCTYVWTCTSKHQQCMK